MKISKLNALNLDAKELTREQMKTVIGGGVVKCFKCCPQDACSPRPHVCPLGTCGPIRD